MYSMDRLLEGSATVSEAQHVQSLGGLGSSNDTDGSTDAWTGSTATISPDAHILVSFDSGYLLFVTLACEVAVAFCILWSTWLRRFDLALVWQNIRPASHASFGRHMCNVLHILTLQSMVIVLAWTASVSPLYDFNSLIRLAIVTSDKVLPDPPIVGWFGCSLAVIFLFLPLMHLSSFLMHSGARSGMYLLGATLLFMLPGLTMLAVYCHRMSVLAQYAYHGPMYVTSLGPHTVLGERPQSTSGLRGWATGETDSAKFYVGRSKVEWGGDWGCPSSPSTWCQSVVDDPSCTYCDRSSSNEVNMCYGRYGEPKNARECLLDKHDLWEFEDQFPLDGPRESEGGEEVIPENRRLSLTIPRSLRPDRVPEEPHGTWYGDCRTCNVVPAEIYIEQVNYLHYLKPIGAVLTITGGLIYLVLTLWLCIPKIANACRGRVHRRRERREQQRQLEEHRLEMERLEAEENDNDDDADSHPDIERSDAMVEEQEDVVDDPDVVNGEQEMIVFETKSIARGKAVQLGQTFSTDPSSDFDEDDVNDDDDEDCDLREFSLFDNDRNANSRESVPDPNPESSFLIDIDNESVSQEDNESDDDDGNSKDDDDDDSGSISSLEPMIESEDNFRSLIASMILGSDVGENTSRSRENTPSDDESVYNES